MKTNVFQHVFKETSKKTIISWTNRGELFGKSQQQQMNKYHFWYVFLARRRWFVDRAPFPRNATVRES